MKEKIQNFISVYGLDGILLIALGIFMLIWPKASLKIICIIIGIILLILGAAKLIQHFSSKYVEESKSDLPVGIIEGILGICLIIFSGFFIKLFPVIAGIILLYGCVMMFLKVYNLRDVKDSTFYSSLIFGIVTLIVGLIMIFNPGGTMAFIVRMAGLGLLIVGIYMLVMKKKNQG